MVGPTDETNEQVEAKAKRPYSAPQLERLGGLVDLTAGTGPNLGDSSPTLSVTAR